MEGRVSCGKSYNESLDSQIKEEARDFNDILAGNFRDTYINLVIKLFMGFAWAKKINCRFVLKADDDVYVHLPKLISWLQQAPSRLYAGHVHKNVDVSRDPHKRNPLPPGSIWRIVLLIERITVILSMRSTIHHIA